MDSLRDILKRYESRDNLDGTDKDTSHSYGSLYERILEPHRHSVKSVLEIGVFSGASACVWAEYFENAHVDGIDITLKRVKHGLSHPRIQYHLLDGTKQASPLALDGKKYGVIVEDASHSPDDQVKSLRLFAPYLASDGIYIIEDIDGKYIGHLKPELSKAAGEFGLRMEWHDLRNVKGRYDDIVAVFFRE